MKKEQEIKNMNQKQEIKTYDVSADGGNTNIKIIFDGKYTSYPNIYAKDSYIDYDAMNLSEDDMDENLRDLLNVRFTWHVGKDDAVVQDFLFGQIVNNNKRDLEERVNADKSDDLMINMGTILGTVNFIFESMPEDELKPEMELNLNLSTGLPYHEYKITSLREKYAKHFAGPHLIEFVDPRYPVKKVTVNIEKVLVKSEGMTALDTTIETKGIVTEENKDSLLDTVWAMIDIGGYTVDTLGGMFRQKRSGFKLEIIDNLSRGLKYGISTFQNFAIDKIMDHYKDKVKSSFRVTRKDINKAEMKEGQLKGILNNKFNTNTTEFTHDEYRKLGRKIGNDFTQLYIENGQMDSLRKIYIAGGGALNDVVVEALINELVNRGFEKDIIEVIDSPNPIYVNAVGYYFELKKELAK